MTTNSDASTTIAELVLSHARGMLQQDDLTMNDDFFEVGGDSLLGMHFVGRVGRSLGLPVRMTLLFAHPILHDFAAAVEVVRHNAIEDAPRADLEGGR